MVLCENIGNSCVCALRTGGYWIGSPPTFALASKVHFLGRAASNTLKVPTIPEN